MTFRNRKTPISAESSVFDRAFAKDGDKSIQWQGFVKKAKLTNAPKDFEAVVETVRTLLEPLAISLAKDRPFRNTWNAPGPWR